jgi:hypothetical protein
MRKSKFSETQSVAILKDAESGVPVPDPLRKHGISKATFFKWRSKYGGASVSDVRPGARTRGYQGCPEPKAISRPRSGRSRQAGPERVHRARQSELSHRGC